MRASNSLLRDIGLPPPEASGIESAELLAAYRELISGLTSMGEGAVANDAWERFQLVSPLDTAAAARLTIFAALVPIVSRVVREYWEREGLEGEPEGHDPARLGRFGRLLTEMHSLEAGNTLEAFRSLLTTERSGAPATQGHRAPGALAGFDWTVTGAKTAWAGQCFAWPFGAHNCIVTASWQTDDFSYTPVLLGFARRQARHRGIGRVIGRTLGAHIGPEPNVSTFFGFSHYEAAFIVTSLHGSGDKAWENPLASMSDDDILRAVWAREGEDASLRSLLDSLLAIREADSIIRGAQEPESER